MIRIKIGTAIRKDLYEALKREAKSRKVSLTELLEEGIVLFLRRQAVRDLRDLSAEARMPRGAFRRVLDLSRRQREGRPRA